MKRKEAIDCNVLIVDDSAETIELIKRNLESAGYRAYSANSVQSAIVLLDSVHIDLLIDHFPQFQN